MRVFLSWSGEKSRQVAEALRDWLPPVINQVEPFVSAKDIDAGARWQAEIAEQLERTDFGIVCVTSTNQDAPWLNFEAGALAKAVGSSRVVPLAIDLKVTDVKPPLAQFQAQTASEQGILALLRSLNKACRPALAETHLLKASETWWPELATKLAEINSAPPATTPQRSDRELLEEILLAVRGFDPQRLSASDILELLRSGTWEPGSGRMWVGSHGYRVLEDLVRSLDGVNGTHRVGEVLYIETSDEVSDDIRSAIHKLADALTQPIRFEHRPI